MQSDTAVHVGSAEECGKLWYSLSCNPDLTLDLLEMMKVKKQQGHKSIVVAQVNNNLPFMYHDAMVDPSEFDVVVKNPAFEFTLPAPANPPVKTADHMIGLIASTLVKEGGTLQIGIGSLGDAIVKGVLLRQQQNSVYRSILTDLGILEKFSADIREMGGVESFDQGLYGASEMFVNQLYGQRELAIAQRVHARFINTTMLATLTGGVCSDGLEDGQVASGVGGQYNFVAMAHEIPGARSILLLRSTRSKNGKVTSNIVDRYGSLTIPRLSRTIFPTR